MLAKNHKKNSKRQELIFIVEEKIRDLKQKLKKNKTSTLSKIEGDKCFTL